MQQQIVPYVCEIDENVALPPASVVSNHSRFEIVSAKVKENAQAASFAKKCSKIELMYCQTAGPGLEEIDIGRALESIANFGALHPRKAVARLELFQVGAGANFELPSDSLTFGMPKPAQPPEPCTATEGTGQRSAGERYFFAAKHFFLHCE